MTPPKQHKWTEADYKNKLEEVLNQYFEKGKSKERGKAMVLFTWAMVLIERALKEK